MAQPPPVVSLQVPPGLPDQGIPPPPQPGNPPTLIDISNAQAYVDRIIAARNAVNHGPGNLPAPSDADLAIGTTYLQQLHAASQVVAPLWFQQWNEQQFQPLVAQVERAIDQVERIGNLVTRKTTQAARHKNEQRATGRRPSRAQRRPRRGGKGKGS